MPWSLSSQGKAAGMGPPTFTLFVGKRLDLKRSQSQASEAAHDGDGPPHPARTLPQAPAPGPRPASPG